VCWGVFRPVAVSLCLLFPSTTNIPSHSSGFECHSYFTSKVDYLTIISSKYSCIRPGRKLQTGGIARKAELVDGASHVQVVITPRLRSLVKLPAPPTILTLCNTACFHHISASRCRCIDADHAMRDVYLTVNIHNNSKDYFSCSAHLYSRILKAMATDRERAEVIIFAPASCEDPYPSCRV